MQGLPLAHIILGRHKSGQLFMINELAQWDVGVIILQDDF